MPRRLLLISNSTVFGLGYLDHAEAELRDVLTGIHRVLFVPYALHDKDGYAAKARTRFQVMSYDLASLADAIDQRRAVEQAEAVFIGGGNTFRLLAALYAAGAIEPIRARVAAGMPYVGSSAGSNVAAPTIKTTNDMPIVQPPTLDALHLVSFQINPHYLDPDPSSTHMGETREERIRQFHEESATPVIGLREGAMLRVEGASVLLRGSSGARIFRRAQEPVEAPPGADVSGLLLTS